MFGLSEGKVLQELGTLGFLAVAASVPILILDGIHWTTWGWGYGRRGDRWKACLSSPGADKGYLSSSHVLPRCFNRISTSFPEISSMVTSLIKGSVICLLIVGKKEEEKKFTDKNFIAAARVIIQCVRMSPFQEATPAGIDQLCRDSGCLFP